MRLAILLLTTLASPALAETVTASFYGYESGNKTANGEQFNPEGMTAAHKTLAFGTRLKVTRGDKSVVVRINDRGPFIEGRTLDLAIGAARKLDMIEVGVAKVTIEVLK